MPGFREGKVPLSIVRQKVAKEETGRQIQENISACIKELIDTKKIIPFSKPDVEILSFDEENGLSVKIAIETMPEVPEVKWEAIEIEKVDIKISDKEINETKNNLLKEFRKFNRYILDAYLLDNIKVINQCIINNLHSMHLGFLKVKLYFVDFSYADTAAN